MLATVAAAVLGLGASLSLAQEPIIGLWQSKVTYGDTILENVIAAWTADGLEFEDYAAADLRGSHLLWALGQVTGSHLWTDPSVVRVRS
jgi:hypothetical protein